MTTTVKKGITETLDASQVGSALLMQGNDNVTLNLPYPYSMPVIVTSMGTNTLTINTPTPGAQTVNIGITSGTLTLNDQLTSSANLDVEGGGKLVLNATIGGRYGVSTAELGVPSNGSTIMVLHNGSLTADSLSFVKTAHININDSYQPVGNIGGLPPSMEIDGVAGLRSASYSDAGGLKLTYITGKSDILPNLHIVDHDLYALVQDAAGTVKIQAAANGFGPYEYQSPVTPPGGHVLQL